MAQPEEVQLVWQRFESFIEARDAMAEKACVYVQTDRKEGPVRVGTTRRDLHRRYWGGTGWALEAAGHRSGNLWFVAVVDRTLSRAVEGTLIWEWRDTLIYNRFGKLRAPTRTLTIRHLGSRPKMPGGGCTRFPAAWRGS